MSALQHSYFLGPALHCTAYILITGLPLLLAKSVNTQSHQSKDYQTSWRDIRHTNHLLIFIYKESFWKHINLKQGRVAIPDCHPNPPPTLSSSSQADGLPVNSGDGGGDGGGGGGGGGGDGV